MYNQIPNYLNHALAKDNEFQTMSETVLINLFNSNDKLYESQTGNKSFEAKLFINEKDKLNYLVVKSDDKIRVYNS